MQLKTEKQRELYEWVTTYLGKNGRMPCLREVAEAFGVSKPTISVRMRALRHMGLVPSWGGDGGWVSKAGRYRRILEWLTKDEFVPWEAVGVLAEFGIPDGSLCLFDTAGVPALGELVLWMGKPYELVGMTGGQMRPAFRNAGGEGPQWQELARGIKPTGVLRCVIQWRGPWQEPQVRPQPVETGAAVDAFAT